MECLANGAGRAVDAGWSSRAICDGSIRTLAAIDQRRPFPARLRLAAFAPFLPSAVRVLFGSFEIVFFFFAARAAFLTFLRAAAFCFELAIWQISDASLAGFDCKNDCANLAVSPQPLNQGGFMSGRYVFESGRTRTA